VAQRQKRSLRSHHHAQRPVGGGYREGGGHASLRCGRFGLAGKDKLPVGLGVWVCGHCHLVSSQCSPPSTSPILQRYFISMLASVVQGWS
jgi:hypothetical protein